jgi:hypothetical protein
VFLVSAEAPKNPVKVRAGQIGADKRWAGHAPVVARMGDLTIPQRRLIQAMIDALPRQEAARDPVQTRSASDTESGPQT